MNISKMHFYSLGKVAANKALNSFDIEAWAYEINPFANNEITDDVQTLTTAGVDSSGNKFTSIVDTTVTLKATWYPFGESNRLTAPDVRRGEEVMLFQFADDMDSLRWTSVHRGIELRRLETIIFAISGSPKEDEAPTADNTYFMEWSSHKKAITLHTSKSNGEACTYDIQINAGDGNIMIKDSIGNHISLDSVGHRIELVNADGSFLDIDKKIITLESADLIQLKSKKIVAMGMQFMVKAPSFSISTPPFKPSDFDKSSMSSSISSMSYSGSLATARSVTGASASASGGAGGSSIGPYPGNEDSDWDDNQTYIKMDREHIWAKALELTDVKSPDITILNTTAKIDTRTVNTTAQDMLLTTGTSTTIASGIISEKALAVTVEASTHLLTAISTQEGNLTVQGDTTVTGKVAANKVTSKENIEAPNV